MSAREEIRVDTPSREYLVHVGAGLLDEVGEIVTRRGGACRASCSAFLVSDSNVGPLYGERVADSLRSAGMAVYPYVFEAGERNKRLVTVEGMLEAMAEAGLTRDDCVVALGGGVCGDMAGLAAALYLRGIEVVQVPTSLLAMVDSSVGGKTAVDLSQGKNLVGAFLQPAAVIADPAALLTLSPELLRDSCGEVIKHAVLADPELLDQLTTRPLTGLLDGTDGERALDFMTGVIARNVRIKRDVVCADERERGLRQTLNLGHTAGHAIEAASGFALGHGTCVTIGLCCVARAAARLGWCDPSVPERIERAAGAHGLPTSVDIDPAELMAYVAHDKKRHGDGVNAVVPTAIGSVEVRRLSLDDFRRVLELGLGTAS